MHLHQHICISPQQTNDDIGLDNITPSVDGKLLAIEPMLEGVPPGMLRRMSKAVRMGIGAGLPLIKNNEVDGIVIGTANGGMEDCIKFLNQIIDYDEGLLTPANFVQSTPNAIAGQLSLITKNRSYNATHVHNGLAFENAVIDAQMLIGENPGSSYLLGGVDEISSYNYNIDLLAGWYDKTKSNTELYTVASNATIAGEGAAMFLVNNNAEEAIAKIAAIEIFQSTDKSEVESRFKKFIADAVPEMNNTLLISGENGDQRFLPLYATCEYAIGSSIPVVRFKHLTGEYPTASAFALWLACQAIQQQSLPDHLYKYEHNLTQIDHVIMYNQYQGKQHSFMYIAK
ncbi:beta-ketoacyl synthase chain length factor [Niabella ginsengisoli]|uniref:Beta-ketoacyl synthase chain length factor n=1 Tax=Niabella ginsengisoli TaxID=522298 RepID=A0ABS9SNB6_9BACT|nr:beta-ketoacyl synthase chain length factor [Niabella ginsengisoli]MCH5599865.1 beta-ketoacyl synthase chain length factor [Niabella ginsengisoli]